LQGRRDLPNTQSSCAARASFIAKELAHARAKRWDDAARRFDEAPCGALDQPEFNYVLGCALSRLARLIPALAEFQS